MDGCARALQESPAGAGASGNQAPLASRRQPASRRTRSDYLRSIVDHAQRARKHRGGRGMQIACAGGHPEQVRMGVMGRFAVQVRMRVDRFGDPQQRSA